MRVLLIWIGVLAATPTYAQHVGIVPFTGPNGAKIRNQVVSALCDTADCIPPSSVTTKNKPDWKKAKKARLEYFIVGTVLKKGRTQTLQISVLGPAKLLFKKAYTLGSSGLAPKTFRQMTEELKSALGASPQAETEPEKSSEAPPEVEPILPPPSPAQPPPEPKDAKPEDPRKESKRAEPRKVVETRAQEPSEEAATDPKPARRIPFVAVEGGSLMFNKSFTYVQPVTNLRRYAHPFFGMAGGKVEFYPMALARQDVLGGIGLEGSFFLATWLQSKRENSDDPPYPTSAMRLDVGLSWRIMPSSSINLSIIPLVGVRYHSFTVAANSAGTRLDLLPNLAYLGVRVGLGFEVGLADDLIFLFGRFQAIPVLSSGEIISTAFFPKGSNFAFDGSAGFGIAFTKMLQLRLSGDVTRYGLSFTTTPTDMFVAQGAVDQYLGGTAALRFSY